MKAHQRIIREQRQTEDADADLFGRWWQGINVDIGKADVREVSYETAASIIEKYEWLGTMPAIVRHCYGIFFDGCCGGVVTYGDEYGENLGIWDRYGYTGKIIQLSRGACVHWAHPHSASKLIRCSINLLPEHYKIVTATTDFEAGEIGTIYQACGFDYVGAMAERNAKQPRKCLLLSNGDRITERQARQQHGSIKNACAVIPGSSRLFLEYKARYFAFRGNRAEIKRHRAAIKHLIAPYPKRAGQVSSRDTVGTPDKAGGSSPAPLHRRALEPKP